MIRHVSLPREQFEDIRRGAIPAIYFVEDDQIKEGDLIVISFGIANKLVRVVDLVAPSIHNGPCLFVRVRKQTLVEAVKYRFSEWRKDRMWRKNNRRFHASK